MRCDSKPPDPQTRQEAVDGPASVHPKLLSQMVSSARWLLTVIRRFLRTVLSWQGGRLRYHPAPSFVLEACVDLGTWYRYGKGRSATETKDMIEKRRRNQKPSP